MFAKQVAVQALLGSKEMDICDRANEQSEPRSSAGPLSWYFAQRTLPELKYVLTNKGYSVLP
jgi:hypothetical protein